MGIKVSENILSIEVVTKDIGIPYDIKEGSIYIDIDEKALKKFIKKHGHQVLMENISYLNFEIWKTVREINSGEIEKSIVNA